MRIFKSHPLLSLVNGYLVDTPSPSSLYCFINVNKTKIIAVILIIIMLNLISICFKIVIPFFVFSIIVYLAILNPFVQYYINQIICIIIGYYFIVYGFAILDLLVLSQEVLYINGEGSNNHNFSNGSGQPGGNGQPGGSGPNNNEFWYIVGGGSSNQNPSNNSGQEVGGEQPWGSGTENNPNPYSNYTDDQLWKKLYDLNVSIQWRIKFCSENLNSTDVDVSKEVQRYKRLLGAQLETYHLANNAYRGGVDTYFDRMNKLNGWHDTVDSWSSK